MKFKDWFDEKLVVIDSSDVTEEMQKLKYHYILTDIGILKKLYSAYKHTGLLDLGEVHIVKGKKDKKNLYFFAVDDKYINFDSIFEFIRNMKGFDILSTLDRDDIKKCFTFIMSPIGAFKDFEDNKEYYFLLSLNPDQYVLEYIESVECPLNIKISLSNTLDGVIDEFINLVKTDSLFRYIVATNWENFAIIGFEAEEDMHLYFKNRRENSKESQMLIISKEDMERILKENSNFSSINSNNTLVN